MADNKEKNWILPVTLCVVSMIMAFLICGVYLITKDNIEARAIEAQENARRSVLPAAVTMTELTLSNGAAVDYCYAGYDASGELVGYVSQITVVGFGGEIEVTVGMDTAGVITAISVGGSDFSETSGLGAKTKEPAFTDQFSGKSGTLVLKENIDSVTGASVSSGAVVGGVNQAMAYMTAYMGGGTATEALVLSDAELAALLPGDTVTFMGSASGVDGWWQGTTGYIVQATGYGHGPIVVKMAFDSSKTCVGIVIGDENFSEGTGYGARVLEPEFGQQFIGKSGVQTYGQGVDAISGATSSSNGTLTAINACMSFDPSTVAVATTAQTSASGETSAEASVEAAAQQVSADLIATAMPTATPVPAATPIATPVLTATPAPDAVSEASVAEAEPTPSPTPVPTPTPTPDAVSEASVTEG